MRVVLAAVAATTLLAAPATAVTAERLWELDALKQPESALYDAGSKVIYVSEVTGEMTAKDGVGGISKVSPDGNMIEADWVTGLDAPKGLGLANGVLYVADIDTLVEIDVASAKIVGRHRIEGAVFLNDVATDPEGRVYVSDTKTNTIWVLENGSLKTWLKRDDLNGPNGLAVEGDALIVASFGKSASGESVAVPGHLLEAPLSGDSLRNLGDASPVGALDGLAALGGGKYLATDYLKGPLLLIDASGAFQVLAELSPGSADLAWDEAGRTVFVPRNKDGKLTAFRIQ